MSTSSATVRRIGRGAVGLMAAAAMVGLTTATASADSAMTINAPAGGFVVGTDVDIDGTVSPTLFSLPWERVTFRDNGTCFFSGFQGFTVGIHVKWTPATAGAHTITLTQGKLLASQTVTVAAAPAGTPVPTPATYGCDGAGSIGTGSFGS
ncbi:hypothetical protein [Nocardia sp. NPDC051981]|uniref:hypothetical protein n=1 Tax=Nocardia sp. NPDC051981 TaxID=3155417 RepID=UPI0034475F94